MGDNDKIPTSSAAHPQLARKYYTVDSSGNDESSGDDRSESDSDGSSLLILSPVQKWSMAKVSNLDIDKNEISAKGMSKKKPPPSAATKREAKLSQKSKPGSSSNKFLKKLTFSSDSDTEDDDDKFLKMSKRVFEKATHQQVFAKPKSKPANFERERKKREREALKEKEKHDRMKKRKEAKNEKERKKREEKLAKKQQNEQHDQAMGKYSYEEIAVLLDENLHTYNSHGLVEALSSDFLVHPYRSKISASSSPNVSMLQFIRKEKLRGGAKHAVDCLESDRAKGKVKSVSNDGYEHIHYLVAVFMPDEIIPLLLRDYQDEDDDYPALESWLGTIRSWWQREWSSSSEPKIIFLLVGMPEALDKKWIEYRRSHRKSNRNGSSLPTVKELHDAMQWILVQFQVECILCPDDEFLQSTVHKMTRGLAEKPYINQVTELECIKKIKQGFIGSDDPLEKATDVWLRQLQQLPGVSETKAQHIVEHFPTIQSLWQAYQWEHHQDEEVENNHGIDVVDRCSALLECKFSADGKRYGKLSDSLYRLLTSNDPNEMIL